MNRRMAKRSKQKSETPSSTAFNANSTSEEPILSAGALNKLTQRIQTNFDKAKVQGKGRNVDSTKGNSIANGNKDKKGKIEMEKLVVRKPGKPARLKKPDEKENRRDRSTEDAKHIRGKKRARDGELKPQQSTGAPKSSPRRPNHTVGDVLPKKPVKKGKIDKEALLKEIIELGGTQEDLDLVNDIESDPEVEETEFNNSSKAEKGLKNELVGFMKEIGLEGSKFHAVADEDEDEEWQVENEGRGGGGERGWEEEEDIEDQEEEDEETANRAPVTTFAAPFDSKLHGSKLLFPPRPDWHGFELPATSAPSTIPAPAAIGSLYTRAKFLLQTENSIYSTTHLTKSSDRQFLSTIMTSGTLTDKISALTLICQESPLHTTKTLETLLGLARKKSRSQAVSAMGAIKDLFASGVVLPPNRKLKFFSKQAGLGAKNCTDLHLLVWGYEDWLKNFYFEILKTLEALCSDQLEFARTNAVGYVWELLKEKPEQEANLLRLLVNKLGDSDKKVSSKVSYLLLKLQSTHPAMKGIIINSIESEVVFRSGNNVHARYYAIITLNQTILSAREVDVANKLLNLYFAVFTSLLKKGQKGMATGVNATGLGPHTEFGLGKPHPPPRGDKMNRKARLRVEAEEKGKQFQEEMNAKLISAVLTGVNRAFPFSQVDDEMFQKHMDTLFHITHSGNFNTSIQALMLIFQVANSKQTVSDRFYRTLYESLLDQRLVNSSKQAMYLNLLFKALKADTQIKRIKAFVKRVIQISTFHQPPFICGVLFLLSELEGVIPSLHSLLDTPQETEEDEEEVFKDVTEEEEGEKGAPEQEESVGVKRVEYDGRKRDPSHANADRSCLWELVPFLSYYHPSVALFASHLLEKRRMPSKPDLGMHTLTHFLDRFVYRNAKSIPPQGRGASIMQPLAGGDTRGMVMSTRGAGKSQTPVNSDAFWKRNVEDVAVDEVFFHKYFNQVAPKKKAAGEPRKATREDSEAEEEENEEEIWKALVGSRPELEGDDLDDGDVDLGDDDDDEMDVDDSGGMAEIASGSSSGGGADGNSDGSDRGPDFGDDGDDVWSDEDDVPDDLQKVFEAELEVVSKKAKGLKAPKEDEVNGRKKRRKLKNLPTFASADDYADMLSD